MNKPVLDSSALLALLLGERGAEAVAAVLPDALLSAVNVAEIVTKLAERGMPAASARLAIEATGVAVVDFDLEQACEAGALRTATREFGLSLGDRACLALAKARGTRAITADAAWAALAGFEIDLIRRHRGAGP